MHGIIHPRNLWVRGSNLTRGHNRLSYPRSADTALKPYLTIDSNSSFLSVLSFGTYVKIGTIQRRLAWPLRKDDTMNTEWSNSNSSFLSTVRPDRLQPSYPQSADKVSGCDIHVTLYLSAARAHHYRVVGCQVASSQHLT